MMYRTFDNKKIDNFNLTEIIHYLIGILNKYKSKENREIDVKTISNAPKGKNFEIAKKFLIEINATELIDRDSELNNHINKLYKYLKTKLENTDNSSTKSGVELLKALRK